MVTDPYKIRLGEDLAAYLDTVPDAADYVRQALRWARDLDLTESSVAELIEARSVLREAADYYREPARAIQKIIGDSAMGPIDDLALLESVGWSRPYICAACDILNGTWLMPYHGPGGVRIELWEGERIALEGAAEVGLEGGGIVEKHGGDPAAWKPLLEALNDETARALTRIVTEFWRGHRVVEKRLGYGSE